MQNHAIAKTAPQFHTFTLPMANSLKNTFIDITSAAILFVFLHFFTLSLLFTIFYIGFLIEKKVRKNGGSFIKQLVKVHVANEMFEYFLIFYSECACIFFFNSRKFYHMCL